jgi:hypothetical protein
LEKRRLGQKVKEKNIDRGKTSERKNHDRKLCRNEQTPTGNKTSKWKKVKDKYRRMEKTLGGTIGRIEKT